MPAATKKAPKTPDPTPPDAVPVDSGVEMWRNITPGTVVISRVGEYGRRVDELVRGGRTFSITPAERRMNQNGVARADMDMFTNGTLQPVALLDDEFDTDLLRQNPNTIDEKDLPRILRLRGEAFSQRIGQITNPQTIARLLEVAREPRHNVTLAQYEALKGRELELRGELDRAAPEPEDPNTAGLPRAVTPR